MEVSNYFIVVLWYRVWIRDPCKYGTLSEDLTYKQWICDHHTMTRCLEKRLSHLDLIQDYKYEVCSKNQTYNSVVSSVGDEISNHSCLPLKYIKCMSSNTHK